MTTIQFRTKDYRLITLRLDRIEGFTSYGVDPNSDHYPRELTVYTDAGREFTVESEHVPLVFNELLSYL